MAVEVMCAEDNEVRENCCLCRAPTKYWFGAGLQNVALCRACADQAKEEDLPTKKQWCEEERKRNPRPFWV